jgi:hypothetical protein
VRATNLRIAWLIKITTEETQLRETFRVDRALSSGRVNPFRSRKTLYTDLDTSSPFPKLVTLATSHLTAPEITKHSARMKSWNFNLSLFTESDKDDNHSFKL